MSQPQFTYPMVIEEKHLDVFGHVNNAIYLSILEQARWDIMNKNGYGIETIKRTGLGPTIFEINIKFFKELLLGDEILIESTVVSYEKRVCKMSQRILRNEDVCSAAELVTGLFDLNKRKLVLPTPEWLHALGLNSSS